MNHIHKISQGDMTALEKLYEQHKVRVYRLALSMLGDPYLAEDVTQETFLRVQERASTYRRDVSQAAWITAIARNLSYDCLRRQNREISNDLTQSGEDDSPLVNTLEKQSLQDTDTVSDLYYLDLVSCLSQKERETVNLRILVGLSWKEIGKILGQQADACRKRYHRALQKLEGKL